MTMNNKTILSSVNTDLAQVLAHPTYIKRERNFYRDRVHGSWGGKHIMHGASPKKGDLLLMSNDYLSLADHPAILQAQANALLDKGNGLLMSAVFLHGDNPQAEFEQRMATFMRAERVILSQSGWCANVGLLQTIADKDTPVYVDMHAHMSLWEGVKAAGAPAYPFLHNNMSHLNKQIQRYGKGVVVVDSVYSVQGSICPLKELVEVAERHGCVIVVDESHSLGTHGGRGEGLVASLGLSERVHFRTASLAKAFAGRAGVITCAHGFYDYFRSNALPAIFSSTLLLHEIVALQKTLDIIMSADDRRNRLVYNSNYLREGLSNLGYNVDSSESQIISLEAGAESDTMILRDALECRGVFGAVFCAPATAKNRSVIRFSIHSALSDEALDKIIDVAEDIMPEVKAWDWPSSRRKSNRKQRMVS